MTELLKRHDGDTIGGRIQKARESIGLTTAELAAKLGVKTETLRGWERDRSEPRANRLITLAGIIGVSPAWLIGGYGEGPEDFELSPSAIEAKLAHLRSRRETLDREIERLTELAASSA